MSNLDQKSYNNEDRSVWPPPAKSESAIEVERKLQDTSTSLGNIIIGVVGALLSTLLLCCFGYITVCMFASKGAQLLYIIYSFGMVSLAEFICFIYLRKSKNKYALGFGVVIVPIFILTLIFFSIFLLFALFMPKVLTG